MTTDNETTIDDATAKYTGTVTRCPPGQARAPDAKEYGGSAQGNFGSVKAAPFGWHERPYSLFITLPPLAAVAFKSQERR